MAFTFFLTIHNQLLVPPSECLRTTLYTLCVEVRQQIYHKAELGAILYTCVFYHTQQFLSS